MLKEILTALYSKVNKLTSSKYLPKPINEIVLKIAIDNNWGKKKKKIGIVIIVNNLNPLL